MHTNPPGKTRRILAAGARLAVFIGIMVFMVSLIHQATRDAIGVERKRVAEKLLYQIAGSDTTRLVEISPDHYQTINGANRMGQIIRTRTQQGYNGEISLWVGIDDRGTITGVRVIDHRETPGLGDPISLDVSDWVLGFNGKSLTSPANQFWKVKKDGGEFDQFTGATITPRAIVSAVHDTLLNNYPPAQPVSD